jgi:hypothetical protein
MFRITPIVLIACAAFFAAGGCNPGPGLEGLQGRWGGPGIIVKVGPSDVRFAFGCNQAISSRTLVADGTGRFSVVATLSQLGAPDLPITVNGRVAAGSMQLDFPVVAGADLAGQLHYEARLGAPSSLDSVVYWGC